MTDHRDKLSKLVNASGFVFQLAVEAAVRKTESRHKWSVHAREYPWKTSSGDGYVDLILQQGAHYLVVECKRQREGQWVFLLPDARQKSRTHALIRWTDTARHRPPLADWGDIQIDPGSPEVEFCIVRGQGEKDRPMLERLAGPLLESVESVGTDLLRINESTDSYAVVVPVILTNAALYLCEFSPDTVDLSRGDIDDGTYTEVSSVRFRKSLARISFPFEGEPESLEHLAPSAERTVFVVNSAHFASWLEAFDVRYQSEGFRPWELARDRANAMGG